MAKVKDYEEIIGKSRIEELYLLAERLSGKIVQTINSTAVGGGVAEILHCMVPLLNELNVKTYWDVIRGDNRFFNITKKFHNALHGKDVDVSKEELDYFLDISRENINFLKFSGDIIFVHDPQPIVLVEKRDKTDKKWVWRCHADISQPYTKVWNFIKDYASRYDAAIFSAPVFARHLPIPQYMISPSIDPLSDKNKELPAKVIDSVLNKYKINNDKPIISQISRYDFLKDPIGVVDAFKTARKYVNCQLVLAGNIATDDPEHDKVLTKVKEKAGNDPDIHVLIIDPTHNDIEINALQRASTIILQKSIREGFALTVTEALWKAKPVIASAVGGIPLQITHKYSGILTHSIEGTGYWIKQLLNEPEYAKKLGENGKAHIKNNFLITRHLREYLLLFLSLYYEGDIISLLYE
ncbi:MAG: glycosyltransferase [Chitinispirillaceae bacterium]|nr:glycosyltransferase [Chitinispirillaceae bacterium]